VISMLKKEETKEEESHTFVGRGTGLLMRGEARYDWTFGIASRKVDLVENQPFYRQRRVSLTFRKFKNSVCLCSFPRLCDSRGYDHEKELKMKKEARENEVAQRLAKERELVGDKESDAKLIQELASNGNSGCPSDLEKAYVYEVYDKIAPHFSNTRYNPWPRVSKFLNALPDYSIVADVGTPIFNSL
jgi:alkylated DNA repair protein alkB homolog 8